MKRRKQTWAWHSLRQKEKNNLLRNYSMSHTFSLVKQSTNLYLLKLINLKNVLDKINLAKNITLKPSALNTYIIISDICTLKETTWNLENAFFRMEEYTVLLFFKAAFKIFTVGLNYLIFHNSQRQLHCWCLVGKFISAKDSDISSVYTRFEFGWGNQFWEDPGI